MAQQAAAGCAAACRLARGSATCGAGPAQAPRRVGPRLAPGWPAGAQPAGGCPAAPRVASGADKVFKAFGSGSAAGKRSESPSFGT